MNKCTDCPDREICKIDEAGGPCKMCVHVDKACSDSPCDTCTIPDHHCQFKVRTDTYGM